MALDRDVLLVHEAGAETSNTRYLSGFASAPTYLGASITLVSADGRIALITSAIAHREPMHSNIQTAWIEDVRCLASSAPEAFLAAVNDVLAEWGLSRVAVHKPALLPHGLHAALFGAAGLDLADAGAIMQDVRRVKSAAERDLIRRLGAMTAAGMEEAVAAARIGATESEIAAAAHAGCVRGGAEVMTFGCFVASGPRSALKNVAPRPDRRVTPGSLVMIDLGCRYRGYQSDMSRNIVLGEIDPTLADMLDTCDAALAAGHAATRPGATDLDVVAAMKAVIADRGHARYDFTIGHGYGLDLLEEPMFDAARPLVLEEGMCFYLEPMIIPPEVGSVCIEDMVMVSADGAENLTPIPTRHWPGA
ncbi:M24 family metallopeptidase [Acuticoccus kandeliae]|uniref:M24 family metallopeptidase n=1 Tax=Acuticoccus kandeliae TaxID=2073160 RepID=UPI0014752B5E|nr:Xaa-Pro peptidase family protein [Acuticoccus kandeliae]